MQGGLEVKLHIHIGYEVEWALDVDVVGEKIMPVV
jgi:hypothetical protein